MSNDVEKIKEHLLEKIKFIIREYAGVNIDDNDFFKNELEEAIFKALMESYGIGHSAGYKKARETLFLEKRG